LSNILIKKASGKIQEYAMHVREGESQAKVWYRSERFFCVDGKWFFSTREGVDVGPYSSRYSANNGLSLYVHFMQTDPHKGKDYASRIARDGLWSTHYWH